MITFYFINALKSHKAFTVIKNKTYLDKIEHEKFNIYLFIYLIHFFG